MNRSRQRSIGKIYRSPCYGFDEKDCSIQENCRYDSRRKKCISNIMQLDVSQLSEEHIVQLIREYCETGNLYMLQYMYKNNVNMDVQSYTDCEYTKSLLNIAIEHDYCDIVTWLIHDVGVDPNTYNKINTIVKSTNIEMLKCLLENGIRIDVLSELLKGLENHLNDPMILHADKLKLLINYLHKFTNEDNSKISETLDNEFYSHNLAWYPDDDYDDDDDKEFYIGKFEADEYFHDQYVDIIWSLLDHGFIYMGNIPSIMDITQQYYYTTVATNLKNNITELGIWNMISKY
jgi:hypothetical protein